MNMLRNFQELEQYILESGIVKTIALCGAHDEPALSAVVEARKKGIIKAILIGDVEKTKEILTSLGESEDSYVFVQEPDESEAAKEAIRMVREGEADIPMKGLMQTSSYMRAILDKEKGILPEGKLLSETTIVENPETNRFFFITDCGINIDPDADKKLLIVRNAVDLAHKFGIEQVKVACLAPLEKVNPKIQSTVDAEILREKQFDDCMIDGPFALDNAVDEEAAKHKGVDSEVAGKADVLLCSDLNMGNVLHKSLHFFAHYNVAATVCGTATPVILTSRTDSPEGKYDSILSAILQSL